MRTNRVSTVLYFIRINQSTQKFQSSPLGDADTDSSAQFVSICLSLSHLTAIYGTKGGEIYINLLIKFGERVAEATMSNVNAFPMRLPMFGKGHGKVTKRLLKGEDH